MQLVGSSLAPGVKPKHVLNVAAAAKQQGPLLGSTPEALMEAHEAAQRRKALPKKSPASGHSMIGLHALHHLGERGVHSTRAMMRSFSIKLHHRTEVAPAWKLHLQHGAVSDLDDERCAVLAGCAAVCCLETSSTVAVRSRCWTGACVPPRSPVRYHCYSLHLLYTSHPAQHESHH